MNMNMKKNEIRVFRITGDAITELMWELLNETGEVFLDLPENSETIFHMNWNKEKDELVFYALEFEHPQPVDFERIDRYIDAHVGITAKSLYDPQKKPFKKLSLNDIS